MFRSYVTFSIRYSPISHSIPIHFPPASPARLHHPITPMRLQPSLARHSPFLPRSNFVLPSRVFIFFFFFFFRSFQLFSYSLRSYYTYRCYILTIQAKHAVRYPSPAPVHTNSLHSIYVEFVQGQMVHLRDNRTPTPAGRSGTGPYRIRYL